MRTKIRPSLRALKTWLSGVVGGTGHQTQFRRGLELTLRSDDDILGLGEASPLPHFSTEYLEDVELALTRLDVFELDLPPEPREFRSLVESLPARLALDVPSARFAFESALIDLCSQYLGVPAANLLRLMSPDSEDVSAGLQVSKLLQGQDQQSLLGGARRAVARGYQTLKIKLGGLDEFEAAALNLDALRQRIDPRIKLRLDPNQGWPMAELPRMLDRLTRWDPELVEEPVAAAALLELRESPVPLALDESLREPGILDRLAPDLGRLKIRAVVLKPALLGLLRALELAEHARELGLQVIVTHLFDGPVGHASAASLAIAIGSREYAHGLAPHPGLLLCPERRVLGLGAGHLRLVDQPGLPLVSIETC